MCDFDGPSVSSTTTVMKSRKEHRCYECRTIIPRGSQYHIFHGCWDGEWSDFKLCTACHSLQHKLAGTDGCLPPFGQLLDYQKEAEAEAKKELVYG